MSDCPTREALLGFVESRLGSEHAQQVSAHVSKCGHCRRMVAEVHDSTATVAGEPTENPSEVREQKGSGTQAPAKRPVRLRDYELQEMLGQGGTGSVFKAHHTRLGRTVAVKVLPGEKMRSPAVVSRFEREMMMVGRLDHPNIVQATDAGEHDGTHFLVMEYVDGLDVGEIVERTGPLAVADACEIARQAALALDYAHRNGMVHRDIKPSNLMLTGGVVKLLDLGLALSLEGEQAAESNLTSTGQIMGTLDYMAPEQCNDSHIVDVRADVYGLGATLYKILTGLAPLEGGKYRTLVQKLAALATKPEPPIRDVRPDVPERLAAMVHRMLAKNPDDRYATPGELADVLAPLVAGSDLADLLRRAGSLSPPVESQEPLERPGSSSSRHAPTVELKRTLTSDSSPADPQAAPQPAGNASQHAGRDSLPSAIHLRSGGPTWNLQTPAVGIDLGTTYSAVARLDEYGRPITLTNSEGELVTPSVVLIEGENIVVGKEAVKALATDSERIAECMKREVGARVFHKAIAGKQFPPEVLQALVLKKIAGDAGRLIGGFRQVVITVPAYFDEVRRKRTQDAGYLAGLDVIDIINEPTAAALSFGYRQGFLNPQGASPTRQRILVYDLGGGTFDVTVMEIEGTHFRTIATDGDMRLGGRDWDERLVDLMAAAFVEEFGIDPREEPNAHGRLWRECEDAKRTLTGRVKATIAFNDRGHALRRVVTREQFDELTADLLDRTRFTTHRTLQEAGLEWGEIDRVLLVGGSSRMPMVRRMLRELTGRDPDASVSADEAVSHGAALRAGIVLAHSQGQEPALSIKNVNSHTLGVVVNDVRIGQKRVASIIPRNTPLPAMNKRAFKTDKQGQKSVRVNIVEGESAAPDGCIPIGRCTIRNLPPRLPARSEVIVVFRYAVNGRLTVHVEVPSTGQRARQSIDRPTGLSKHELETWRQWVSQLEEAV